MKKLFCQKTIQQNGYVYLMINCAFLLPILLLTQQFMQQWMQSMKAPIADFFGYFLLIYWVPAIFYYLLGLPYLHFALYLGFLVFSIYKLVKEKNGKLFLRILLLTTISAALNFYWLAHGRSYTIV